LGYKTADTTSGLLGIIQWAGEMRAREQTVVDARIAVVVSACPSGSLDGDKAAGNDGHNIISVITSIDWLAGGELTRILSS